MGPFGMAQYPKRERITIDGQPATADQLDQLAEAEREQRDQLDPATAGPDVDKVIPPPVGRAFQAEWDAHVADRVAEAGRALTEDLMGPHAAELVDDHGPGGPARLPRAAPAGYHQAPPAIDLSHAGPPGAMLRDALEEPHVFRPRTPEEAERARRILDDVMGWYGNPVGEPIPMHRVPPPDEVRYFRIGEPVDGFGPNAHRLIPTTETGPGPGLIAIPASMLPPGPVVAACLQTPSGVVDHAGVRHTSPETRTRAPIDEDQSTTPASTPAPAYSNVDEIRASSVTFDGLDLSGYLAPTAPRPEATGIVRSTLGGPVNGQCIIRVEAPNALCGHCGDRLPGDGRPFTHACPNGGYRLVDDEPLSIGLDLPDGIAAAAADQLDTRPKLAAPAAGAELVDALDVPIRHPASGWPWWSTIRDAIRRATGGA